MITTQTAASDLLPPMPAAPVVPGDDVKSTKAFDKALGARVKILRQLRGISQEKLADQLGLTFQQVQKYETGANRFPIARLCRIAEILECKAAFLIGESQAEDAHLIVELADRRDVAALLPRLLDRSKAQVRAVTALLDSMAASEA